MIRSLLAIFVFLFVTVGLAYGEKSPPYDPKTGVYTIDWATPKNQNNKNLLALQSRHPGPHRQRLRQPIRQLIQLVTGKNSNDSRIKK